MSVVNRKKNIFTTIGAYKSMDLGSPNNSGNESYSSIDNKDEPIPFLLDMLKTVGGEKAIDEGLGGIISEVIDESEDELKDTLENQLTTPECDTPLNETEFGNNGIEFDIDEIDVFGKLHEPNDSLAGELLYGDEDNFDKAVRDAISSGSEVTYNDFEIKFNENTQKLNIKPIVVGGASTIAVGAFIGSYLKKTKLIDKKAILSSTMDEIFGSISRDRNVSEKSLVKQNKISKVIENLVDGDESMELKSSDLALIYENSKERASGIIKVNVGCCIVDYEIPIHDIKSTIDIVVDSNNRFEVGSTIKNMMDFGGDDDDNTMKMGFIERIIKTLVVKLVEATTQSPEVKVLTGIVGSIKSGVAEVGDAYDDLKKKKSMVICLRRKILKIVLAFLFALATAYLIKMLKPAVKKITKEKIDGYVTQLKSLVGIKRNDS